MGTHDKEDIIDLTEVIDDQAAPPASPTKTGDFPPEQALDPKALEDEFEALLKGSDPLPEPTPAADQEDGLDIDSLFDDLTDEPQKDETASSTATEEASLDKDAADTSTKTNDDLEELFASLDYDDDDQETTSQEDLAELLVEDPSTDGNAEDMDSEIEALLADETIPPATDDDQEINALLEDATTPPAAETQPASLEKEPESQTDEHLAGTEVPQADDPKAQDAQADDAETQDAKTQGAKTQGAKPLTSPDQEEEATAAREPSCETETETAAALEPRDKEESALPVDETARETNDQQGQGDPAWIKGMEERLALLEAQQQGPDEAAMFAMFTSFFQKSEHGSNLLENLKEQIIEQVQETTSQLVQEHLASLQIPSAETLATMIREAVNEAAAEDVPAPPDTQSILRDLQEDRAAWEAAITALEGTVDDLKQALDEASSHHQARLDEIADSLITKAGLHDIKEAITKELHANLATEIPRAAAQIIREEIAALMQSS